MKKFLLFTLMLVVSLQYGCGDREARTSAAPEAVMTNGQLEQQVEAQLRGNAAYKDVDVDANADRNMVTLKGTVETEVQRNSAAELARMAHPGVTVNNELKVEPREKSRADYTEEDARGARAKAADWGDKLGSSLDDAWIHTKITTKLIGDTETPAHRINVDVNNNVVTLRGTVSTTEEKMEAERLAMNTDGVKRVINQLKVSAK
jgi:osmotically-inducible protein OsmY